MSNPSGHIWNIDLTIHEDGTHSFTPKEGPSGYQFERHAQHGVIRCRLVTEGYVFIGCTFVPFPQSGMPGVQARWGHTGPERDAIVVTFDYPGGALHDGQLRLECMHVKSQRSQVIDPQVGNDGHTGGG